MLEINDHIRLVKHSNIGQNLWIAQQRSYQSTSYKREIWTPVSHLLTPHQAESWLTTNDASDEVLQRFKETIQ